MRKFWEVSGDNQGNFYDVIVRGLKSSRKDLGSKAI
jgi:hypothetical protein